MFCETDSQAMKILFEEDRENILNALGLFEKKKLIHVQEKLSAETKKVIVPEKRRSQLLGIPISVSKSKLDYRRSLRIHTKSTDDFGNHVPTKFSEVLYPLYSATKVHKVRVRKKSTTSKYGSVKGVSVGDKWNSRVECSHAGVHKPTVAGIHAGKEGAYSIAISGNYKDDQDNGYCFTYTESGRRDLTGTKDSKKSRVASQSKDQTIYGANISLIRSIETRNPVRVIRGYKLDSPFAPDTGYRYDGLYTVEKYWKCIGKSGFMVYKFLLKRCSNQAPAPWHKREPFNSIKIVKIRKKRLENRSTVLNFSGKLTMNEENGDKITTCEVSQMQLQLNTDVMNDSVKLESSAVFLNRDCETRLNPSPSETHSYQRANASENETGEKSSTDDSNKENNNKVIIKTRWRRSRKSLPNPKHDTSSPQSSTESNSRVRQYKKRSSCSSRRSAKESSTSQYDEDVKPPKIAYFNISNDQSFKWSLFASEEEIKIFQKYFRKNASFNHAADYEGEFKGFDCQDSLNKLMILGFIINDIEKKQHPT